MLNLTTNYIVAYGLLGGMLFLIALFILTRKIKPLPNVIFAFYSLSISWWSIFTIPMITADNEIQGIMWDRICLYGAIFIPPTFLHFVVSYLQRMSKLIILVIFSYLVAGILVAINAFGYLFDGVKPTDIFAFYTVPNVYYTIYVGYFSIISSLGIFFLWAGKKQYPETSKNYRTLRTLWLFSLLGYAGGGTNFLLVYGFQIPFITDIANYAILIYAMAVAYLILRHQFLDIDVIIKKTIIFTGLTAVLSMIVSAVSALIQSGISQKLHLSQNVVLVVSVGLSILAYEPVKKLFVAFTDRYLFQKKAIYYKLLKENSKQIAMIHSLDEIAKQIVAFLIKQGRIRNAGILIYSDEKKSYRLRYPLGYGGREKRPDLTLQEDHPIIQRLNQTKSALIREELMRIQSKTEIEGYSAIFEVLKHLKAEVVIPSFLGVRNSEGENTGESKLRSILVLGQKKSDQEYTEEDLSVFYTIAQESAIAAEKARLFDVLLKEREEKTKAQSEAKMVAYAKSIAHEIKNALAGLYGPAEFLNEYAPDDLKYFYERYLKDAGNEDAKKSFEKLIQKMKDKGAILRNKAEEIRIVAKTAQGTLVPNEEEFEEFSFKVVWDAAVATVKDKFPQCEFVRDLPLPYPYGNVVLIQRVIVNLFMNAAEAMEKTEKPEITVRGKSMEMDGRLGTYFEIEDNGPGIPQNILEHIFEQGFSTKPKPKSADIDVSGHGQGLWVCKQSIETIHGGKLWVESQMDKGTTFKIWLPGKK